MQGFRGAAPAHHRRTWLAAMAAVLLATSLAALPASVQDFAVADRIARALLLWFDMPGPADTSALPTDVRDSLATYRLRLERFRPSFVAPGSPLSPEHSVQLKRIALERVLFALFDGPDSAARAREYARRARISYEWEGHADGPLWEADIAEQLLHDDPDSPIAPYIHLFIGHRQLCAVSGLEGLDPSSDKAVRIGNEADRHLSVARDAGHALIRFVAERLLQTRRCFYGDG